MLTVEDNELLTTRRARYPYGRPAAPLLDAGAALDRGAGAGQPAGARAAAGRGPGRLPRHQRRRGPVRAGLSASRRIAVLRAQRRSRPALRLPRLEVRHDRRLCRHAVGAGREQLQEQGARQGLPDARVGRRDLDLHGPGGDDDRLPRLRYRDACRRRTGAPRGRIRPATGCSPWKATWTPPTSPGCTSTSASSTPRTTAPTAPATRATRCRGSSGRTTARRGWSIEDTWYGYKYAGVRTTPNGHTHVRISAFAMPYTTVVATTPFGMGGGLFVPIDDESCWRWFFATTSMRKFMQDPLFVQGLAAGPEPAGAPALRLPRGEQPGPAEARLHRADRPAADDERHAADAGVAPGQRLQDRPRPAEGRRCTRASRTSSART